MLHCVLRLLCLSVLVLAMPAAVRGAAAPATLPASLAADPAAPGELILVMHGAVGRGRMLIAHLESRDGRWVETWGEADINVVLHTITITESSFEGGVTRLKMDVTLRDDFWIKGGSARYELEFRRKPATGPVRSGFLRLLTTAASHTIEGTYRGAARLQGAEQAVEGAIEGILLPPRTPPASFIAPPADEHPRLLMRKAEVPILRQRLQTPLGRAVVEQLKKCDHEVAEAILYQLTGEVEWARKAWARVDVEIGQEKSEKTKGYGGTEAEHTADYVVGHQITSAQVWDLCWEAWTPGQRQQLLEWMVEMCRFNVYRPWTYSNTGSTGNIRANATMTMSGGATIALNLWGLNSPPPVRPRVNHFEERFRAERPGWFAGPTYEQRLKAWETEVARWKAAGEVNLEQYEMARYARQALGVNINHNIGEGGSTTALPLMDWAIAFRNVMGTDVTGRPEIPLVAAEVLFSTVRWQSGRGAGQTPVFRNGSDWWMGPPVLARWLALSPNWLKPAVKDYWLRMVGLNYEDLRTDEGARKFMERSFAAGRGEIEGWGPLYALQYMLEGAPPKPAGDVLPRIHEHISFGWWAVRSGWDAQAVLMETEACTSARPAFGAVSGASAGNFNLWGFGRQWTCSRPGVRAGQNTVQLPGIIADPRSHGQVVHAWRDDKLGVATLTVAMDDSFRHREEVTVMRTETRTDGWITRTKEVPSKRFVLKDAGIRGIRAFASDGSGRCGAPGLLAIADRITGPRKKVWTMNVPTQVPRGQPATEPVTLEIAGNTFTLRDDRASVRGTFIAPAGVRIARVAGRTVTDNPDVPVSKHSPNWVLHGIEATAPDETVGDFLVVMTIQDGPPPAIRSERDGADQLIKVGDRLLRFDGQKFTIAP